MGRLVRLTIDINVARDFMDSRRPNHDEARALFALNRSEVELAIGPQGRLLDAPNGQLAGDLAKLCNREGLVSLRQLAYLSDQTYPSDDLYPGQYVDGFKEAWTQVVETWKSHEGKPPRHPDDFHVEAHVFEERDAFLTSDASLLVMCQKLRTEHGIPILARTVTEYLEKRGAKTEQQSPGLA
jgi:Fe-S oxidoreductase